MKIAGDRATIEAAIDDELERTDDEVELGQIVARVSKRLGASPELVRAIAATKCLDAPPAESSDQRGPGKFTRTLAAVSRKQKLRGSRTPGKQTLTALIERRATARPVELKTTDDLRQLLGFSESGTTSTGQPQELPHRSKVEDVFGVDLGSVKVRTGQLEVLQEHGAVAAAGRDSIAFADESPSLEIVAHEVAHVLQNRRTSGTPSRPMSAAGDGAEREAARAASHASRFRPGMRPFQVRAAPTAQIHFQREGEKASGEAEDREELSCEPAIIAELGRSVATTDAQGLQDRKRALIHLFRAIPRPERSILRERIAKSAKDDRLATAFRSRLAKPTRRTLLAALAGEPVPLPGAADSVLFTAFGAPANQLRLVCEPNAASIDPTWVRSQPVAVNAEALFGPPADGSPVTLQWNVKVTNRDGVSSDVAEGIESWTAATSNGPRFQFEASVPGTHELVVDLVADGVIGKTERTTVDVSSPEHTNLAVVLKNPSIDLALVAHNMSDNELVSQARAIQEDLAITEPTGETLGDEPDLSADYRTLRRALHVLRFAASQRGLSDELFVFREKPAETTPIRITGLEIDLAVNDPAVLRGQLETLISQMGHDGTERYLQPLLSYDRPGPSDDGVYAARAAVLRQLGYLRVENQEFVEAFATAGKQVGLGLLAESEMHVRSAMAQYGISEEEIRVAFPAMGGGEGEGLATGELKANTEDADTDELGDMQTYARRLVTLSRAMAQNLERRQQLAINSGQTDFSDTGPQFRDLDSELGSLTSDFETTRDEALEKHPALEDFLEGGDTTDAMKELSKKSAKGAAKAVGRELVGHLMSIREARDGITSGDLPIWENPKIVEVTKAHLGVAPGSMRAGVVAGKVAEEIGGGWTDTLITVVLLGAALVATVLPGTQALAAEIALVAVDLALLSEDIDAYKLQKAATNTDFAEARKLAAGEPSLFPIILGIIGTGVGLAGVKSAVAKAQNLRRAVQASGDVADPSARAIADELNALGAAHGKPNLGDELLESAARGNDAIAKLARLGPDAVAGTVAEQGTETLARRLGVRVDVDEGLGKGVRIDYSVDDKTGRVVIGGVRVGPQATADVVLAHRKVIARMTRYNGVIGSLRRVWDRLRDAAARVIGKAPTKNPFPKGTHGWESWEELRKLDELIGMRRAAWPNELTADLLDADIAFLKARREFHEGIVRSIDSGGIAYKKGVGFVAMPTRGRHTKEAIAAGYPDPPEHCFYRRLPEPFEDGRAFELHRDPLAPKDAKLEDLQPEMRNGKPTGKLVSGGAPLPKTPRVEEPVDGLYDSVENAETPAGWSFDDVIERERDGSVRIRTSVTGPNGETGNVTRVYHAGSAQLEMRAAFLHGVPRWIVAGTPLVPSKGTPTMAFIQLRQMKKLGISRSGIKKVKMSSVLNVTTAVQLDRLLRAGTPLNEAILKTHSVQYAQTALVQTGHRIRNATVIGGDKWQVHTLLGRDEIGDAAKSSALDTLLAENGVSRSDKVLAGFDIELELMPWSPIQ